jgi:WD40 repeat protein
MNAAVGAWENAGIFLWDTTRMEAADKVSGKTPGIRSLAFAPDSDILPTGRGARTLLLCDTTGSFNTTVRLWDVTFGEEQKILQGHTAEVWTIAFSLDVKSLASGRDMIFWQ